MRCVPREGEEMVEEEKRVKAEEVDENEEKNKHRK